LHRKERNAAAVDAQVKDTLDSAQGEACLAQIAELLALEVYVCDYRPLNGQEGVQEGVIGADVQADEVERLRARLDEREGGVGGELFK